MAAVNVRDLRAHMKDYMDRLEQGEELIIIRNSKIIGRLVPSDEIKAILEVKDSVEIADNKRVKFRRFGIYEDPEPVMQLHRLALEAAGAYVENPDLDRDLYDPNGNYEKMGGEFWIGELDGEIVAMGGFRINLSEEASTGEAELKRMRVKPELQGQHIGSSLLELLEGRARKHGYKALVLDVTSAEDQQPARKFYEKHGFHETHREPSKNFDLIFCKKEL